jgi:hypothetical protein
MYGNASSFDTRCSAYRPRMSMTQRDDDVFDDAFREGRDRLGK